MATFARAIFVDHAGRIVTRKTIFNASNFLDRSSVWLRFGLDGSPRDTLRAPLFRDVPKLMATSGRATVTMDVPFMPRRLVALSPRGPFITGYPDRYAFEIHQPDGSIISIRREVKAEPVSRSERANARREVEERMRQTDPTWSWNGPDIPDVKPLYADLQVGLDGRIWVAVHPEASPRVGTSSSGGGIGPARMPRPRPPEPPPPDPRPALYDVFEPDGQYLGQVQVPARVSSVVRRGDTVWAVAWGDDDVPRIMRYRIAWRN